MQPSTASLIPEVAVALLLAWAAYGDIRTRRLPNGPVVAMTLAAAALVAWFEGLHTLLGNAVVALVLLLAFVGYELGWRKAHGTAGFGMGDIKALACLCVVDPWGALVACAAGLVLLAVTGMVTRQEALPYLPFLLVGWVLVILLGV